MSVLIAAMFTKEVGVWAIWILDNEQESVAPVEACLYNVLDKSMVRLWTKGLSLFTMF